MSKIKISVDARATIAPLGEVQDPKAAKILDQAIAAAASVDGDRVLDSFEAEAVRQTFDDLVPVGQAVDEALAHQVSSALDLRIREMKAERAQSTEAIFTSEGKALERFRGKILGSLQETIDKAAGRPVDVNMMIFAFTDTVMADALVKMARENPNVTIRLITDWTQLAASGGRQPPRLAQLASDEGLANLQVKFKKDDPYIWDDRANRPLFSHGNTKGLNHHKGFVSLIDGRPEKMTFGSFNWSVGAMKSNYENLMLIDRADPDNRRIMEGYQKEFEGFWNNDDAALTYSEARRHKNALYKKLYDEHGLPYSPSHVPDGDLPDPEYHAEDKTTAFDVNSFACHDDGRLEAMTGKAVAGKIQKELRDYGRFDTWTELLARVPDVAELDTWVREQLRENVEFGNGGLSINTATVEELDRAGLSRRQAEQVVAFREAHGAFESLDELADVKGIGKKTIARLRETLTDDHNVGTYSARVPGGDATTGWDASHHGTLDVPSTGAVVDTTPDSNVVPDNRAELEAIERNMASLVVDMLRRTEPGQTMRMAMYGISKTSPEFEALAEALRRGVRAEIVLYKSYNEGAIEELQRLRDQEGLGVDLRIISSRVMHQKFGVTGDDVFNGSANWSSSSITKHTEDRFLFRNMPALADRFREEFARLWERANPV